MLNHLKQRWLILVCILVSIGFVACYYVSQNHKHIDCPNTETAYDCTEQITDSHIALYTKILAVFTAVLAVVGIIQGILINRQLLLAREEFIATHRPSIVIRSVLLLATETTVEKRMMFYIHNTGSSKAIVTGVKFYMSCSLPNQEIRPSITTSQPIFPITIETGDRVQWYGRSDSSLEDFLKSRVVFATRKTKNPPSLNLRITIFYQDTMKRKRETSIHREYDFNKGRFRPSENSEFEYAD